MPTPFLKMDKHWRDEPVEILVASSCIPPSAAPGLGRADEQAVHFWLAKLVGQHSKAAEIIVIASPMYNFTVPSTLKAWIDHVAIAGQTFRYAATGPEGLLPGKKACLVPLGTCLEAVLGFIGITDVKIVRAEGLAYGPEQDREAMAQAQRRIVELAA